MGLIEKLNSREKISLYTTIMGVFMLGVFIYDYYKYFSDYRFDFFNFLLISIFLILSIILLSTGLLFYKDKKFGFESNLISLGMLFSLSLWLFIRITSLKILNYLGADLHRSFNFISYIIVLSIIPTVYFIWKLYMNKDNFTSFKKFESYKKGVKNYTFVYLVGAGVILISFFLIFVKFFNQTYEPLPSTHRNLSNLRIWDYVLFDLVLDNIIFLIIGLMHLFAVYFVYQKNKFSYEFIFVLIGITFYTGLREFTRSINSLFVAGRSSYKILEEIFTNFFEYFGKRSLSANAFIFSLIILILSIVFIFLFLLKRQELYTYLEKETDM